MDGRSIECSLLPSASRLPRQLAQHVDGRSAAASGWTLHQSQHIHPGWRHRMAVQEPRPPCLLLSLLPLSQWTEVSLSDQPGDSGEDCAPATDGKAKSQARSLPGTLHVGQRQVRLCGAVPRYVLAGGNRCLHAAHIPERKWHACLMPATTEQYATQVQTELKLRSTSRGANNRLDILSLVSGVQDSDDPRDQRRYNQGTTSYVFVPWSDIPNHCLNLPVSEMDFWIPG
mmetsp:Transcript_11737/g.42876  ORF Transcript_11737/g.42876 Transcript_11737/m.42876 type:complete len:229 (-) Transcript_11737:125-811(-)